MNTFRWCLVITLQYADDNICFHWNWIALHFFLLLLVLLFRIFVGFCIFHFQFYYRIHFAKKIKLFYANAEEWNVCSLTLNVQIATMSKSWVFVWCRCNRWRLTFCTRCQSRKPQAVKPVKASPRLLENGTKSKRKLLRGHYSNWFKFNWNRSRRFRCKWDHEFTRKR